MKVYFWAVLLLPFLLLSSQESELLEPLMKDC